MVAATQAELEIVARLKDEVSPGFAKLQREIEAFSKVAPLGSKLLSDGARELAAASDAAAVKMRAATQAAQQAVNEQRALLKNAGLDQVVGVQDASQNVLAAFEKLGPVLAEDQAQARRLFSTIEVGSVASVASIRRLNSELDRMANLQNSAGRGVQGLLTSIQRANIASAQSLRTGVAGGGSSGSGGRVSLGPIAGLGAGPQGDNLDELRAKFAAVRSGIAETRTAAAAGSAAMGGLSLATLGAVAAFAAVAFGVYKFYQAAGEAADRNLELERSLLAVARASNQIVANLDAVKQQIRDLSSETGRSREELVALTKQMADFGLARDEALQSAATTAADAGFGPPAEAFNRVSALIRAFRQEVNQANFEDVANQIRAVSEAAEFSTEKLADATARAAPTASDFGVSLIALSTSIAQAAKATGNADQAATSAAAAIKALATEGDPLNNLFQSLGIAVDKAALEGDGFVEVLQQIAALLRDRPELRGKLPPDLVRFFEAQTQSVETLKESVEQVPGAVRRAQQAIQSTRAVEIERAAKRFEDLKDQVLEAILPIEELKGRFAELFLLIDEKLPLERMIEVGAEIAKWTVPLAMLAQVLEDIDKLTKDPKAKETLAQTERASGTPSRRSLAERTGVFNEPATIDLRVSMLTDQQAKDEFQRSVEDLLASLDTASRTLELEPQIAPEDVERARATLAELSRLPKSELLDSEAKAAEEATAILKRYEDSLKAIRTIGQQGSAQLVQGYDRQRQAIERARQEALQQLEVERQRGRQVTLTARAVNAAADAELARVNTQEYLKRLAAEGQIGAVLQAQLKTLSEIASAKGDLAEADRLDLEAVQRKATQDRAEIERARLAAVAQSAGDRELIDAANKLADAKRQQVDLELQLAEAVQARQAAERERSSSAAVQAASDALLKGLDAELAAIERNAQARRLRAREDQASGRITLEAMQQVIQAVNQDEDSKRLTAELKAVEQNTNSIIEAKRILARSNEEVLALELQAIDAYTEQTVKQLDINKATADQIALIRQAGDLRKQQAIEEANANFGFGFRKQLGADVAASARDAAHGIKLADEAFTSLGTNAADALTLLQNGTESAGEATRLFVESFLRDMQRAINQILAFRAASALLNFILPGAGGAAGASDLGASGVFPGTGFAYGGVFDNGPVERFARGGGLDRGRIHSTPTHFPLGGGRLGLLGEAGPEAIMPLVKLPSGRYGIESLGGRGGQGVTINMPPVALSMNIQATDAATFKEQVLQQMPVIASSIESIIRSGIHDGLRGAIGGVPRR